MAIADFASYRAARPYASPWLSKGNLSTIDGRFYSRWLAGVAAGSAPTTAAATSAATVGAIKGMPTGMATWLRRVVSTRIGAATIVVYDRLSHQGGLSGTVTSPQTTNLPTAALTRYTSGVGVMAALEVYTIIGTTATTYSISYTNSAGTAGRTSPLQTVGGTNDRAASLFIPTPLQVGDVGVKSVESVTLTATTGTAGAFGITLWRPLFSFPVYNACGSPGLELVRHLGAYFESIQSDACLAVLQGASPAGAMLIGGMGCELMKQV